MSDRRRVRLLLLAALVPVLIVVGLLAAAAARGAPQGHRQRPPAALYGQQIDWSVSHRSLSGWI